MKHQQGFTIIELAVVLTIVGLLIASLLVPLSTQINSSKTQGNYEMLAQAKQALINYAVMNKRLPCPASQKEIGKEDSTLCDAQGYLPWADLGVNQSDAWGYPLRYRIDSTYQEEIPNSITTTRLAIEVQEGTIIPDVVAIIFSYGKNGQYALKKNPLSIFPEAFANLLFEDPFHFCGLDQIGMDKICYYDAKKNPTSSSDDDLVWLTQSVLMEQVVAAGNFKAPEGTDAACIKHYLSYDECMIDIAGFSTTAKKKLCKLCLDMSNPIQGIQGTR